jgi:hypothetical protein
LVGVLVVGIVVVAVLVWRGDSDETAAPVPPTTTQRSITTALATTTTTALATTTASRTATATAPPGSVPGAVVAVAKTSGGSGEVQVDWQAVSGATGYRVLRTDAAGGQPGVVADFDITTGRTTAASEAVNVWSAEHSYVPDRGPLARADQSPWFQYIDIGAGQRCYRVLAYSPAGDGPLSDVTCGSPPGP